MYDNDHVKAGTQREALGEDQLAKLPLEPVADDRTLYAPSGAQPDARYALAIRQRPDGELGPFRPSSPSIDGTEGVSALETDGPGCRMVN